MIEVYHALVYGIYLTDEQFDIICDEHDDIHEDVDLEDFFYHLNALTMENPIIATDVKTFSEENPIFSTLANFYDYAVEFLEKEYYGKNQVDEIYTKLNERGMNLPPPTFYVVTRIY